YLVMADFTIKHSRQACRRCQALVANQVVCIELCFFFIHPEMIRFLGWGCVTSVKLIVSDNDSAASAAIAGSRITRQLNYQIAELFQTGKLKIVRSKFESSSATGRAAMLQTLFEGLSI
ncbi:MAG: hypothetical protein Q8M96_00155, partial [Rubrivivax sp.]|nr:hypothetical protein [Rubrivivax sp.]